MIFRHITKLRGKIFWLLLWAIVMPLTGSLILSALAWQYPESIRDPAPLLIFSIYLLSVITMGLALTPTTFVAVMGGAWLGWQSLPLMILSYTLASLLGYTLASRIEGDELHEQLEQIPAAKPYVQGIDQSPLWLVVWSRLSPVLPFAVMNILLASLKVPVRSFLLGGVPGMLPRTALACWIGIGLSDLLAWWDRGAGEAELTENLISLSLLIISTLGLSLYMRRARRIGSNSPA